MRYEKSGFRAKAAAAVKFFFMGDDEMLSPASSDPKELSPEELGRVTGGQGDKGRFSDSSSEGDREPSPVPLSDALEQAAEEKLRQDIELFFD